MSDITLLGGGCTGPLIALLLARRGHRVTLYERRHDPRLHAVPAGRSINLALADRGIRALERAGLMDKLRPALVPMHSRMIHETDRAPVSLRYGQAAGEVLWSASRAGLHRLLVEAAAAEGVDCRFGQALVEADFDHAEAILCDVASDRRYRVPLSPAIASDGSGSIMRSAMVRAGLCRASEDRLPHCYKELNIAADAHGRPRLDSEHLHIWPRGQLMLIARPNADQTFTATLFMPAEGDDASFQNLSGSGAARRFFEKEFPDALELIDDFESQYDEHPIGQLATIRTDNWHAGGMALLMGDAAHAIVPFHGQGLNCCFEDCLTLDALLAEESDWETVFRRFTDIRRPNANAIADMALENYVEMRDAVRHPRFRLQKELALTLERRHPDRFIPRYSMVMFHAEIPYAVAQQRGAIQADILDELTRDATTLDQVDLGLADSMILERLSDLGAAAD